jgi:hypothetical protein
MKVSSIPLFGRTIRLQNIALDLRSTSNPKEAWHIEYNLSTSHFCCHTSDLIASYLRFTNCRLNSCNLLTADIQFYTYFYDSSRLNQWDLDFLVCINMKVEVHSDFQSKIQISKKSEFGPIDQNLNGQT